MAKRPRGAPGIYELEPGLFKVVVSLGRDGTGRYRQQARTVRGTLREANALRARVLTDAADGKLIPRTGVSFGAVFERWLQHPVTATFLFTDLVCARWRLRYIHTGRVHGYRIDAWGDRDPKLRGLRVRRGTGRRDVDLRGPRRAVPTDRCRFCRRRHPVSEDIPGTLLLDPKVIEDPQPFYRQLRTHAPVWQVPGTDVFVVSSFAMVADAVARVEDFSSNMLYLLYRDDEGLPRRLSFGDSGVQTLATADPPIHTVHRSVVFPELMAKRMAELESEIADIAGRGVGRALDDGNVDFMAEIGNVVPITIISRLIGFRGSDPDRLLQAAFDSTLLIGVMLSLQQLQALVARSDDIGAWMADQLATAADQPEDDILGTIARGKDAGALGLQEGIITLQTLLSAGGESTTSLLGNAVRILAEREDLQQRLRRHPELLPAFVEEALRLESPFRYHMRSVPKNTTLGDVDIPAGATVLLFWGAANRDPAEYKDPDEVVLDRQVPRHHVAFGHGIHYCVGAPLARLEARVVLTMLLEQTSSITLDPQQPPQRVESLLVRRHEKLPVQVVPR